VLGGERAGLAPSEERPSDGDVRRLGRARRPAFLLAAPALGAWRPVLHRALQSALGLGGGSRGAALPGLAGLVRSAPRALVPGAPRPLVIVVAARAFLARGARLHQNRRPLVEGVDLDRQVAQDVVAQPLLPLQLGDRL